MMVLQSSLFPARFGGVFLALLLLSVIKPSTAFGIEPLPLAPVLLVIMAVVLVWQIHQTIGFVEVIKRYWFEILMVVGFVGVCLYSLKINRNSQYPSDHHLLHLGLVPVAVWLALPMMLLLFNLPVKSTVQQQQKMAFWVWGTMAAIALLAIWQAVDYQSAFVITEHFVAVELPQAQNISSVFRISTDLGPIMAFCILALLCHWRHLVATGQQIERKGLIMLIVMVALFFAAGLASGSRNFMLTSTVGCLVIALTMLRRHPFKLLFTFIVTIVIFHLIVFLNDGILKKYASILPYLFKLKHGLTIGVADFIPAINNKSLTLRVEIWERATTFISENWALGITNGGFKQRNLADWGVTLGNTHNYFLQLLIDAGIYGLVFSLLLHLKLILRLNRGALPLFSAIFISQLFDYHLDHSLPWIICVAWLLANTSAQCRNVNSD
ncbi:MAG: hypothetical protein CMK65_01165 [Pseudoalteromonas sp.]|uniref:O-antigen ligase family protein n=1 Tax=Pseudoalteromonas sp. TaxID=53249 RepID=UPI000C8F4086|nr:O-antigen ligase family protein [Pseudoalteromonas sp.]MAD02224.1 hypothetical protein [Pseudoalteromonas sp.]